MAGAGLLGGGTTTRLVGVGGGGMRTTATGAGVVGGGVGLGFGAGFGAGFGGAGLGGVGFGGAGFGGVGFGGVGFGGWVVTGSGGGPGRTGGSHPTGDRTGQRGGGVGRRLTTDVGAAGCVVVGPQPDGDLGGQW